MLSVQRARRVPFPAELKTFWLVSIVLCVLCVVAEVFCARVLHLGYPYNWPLTPHGEHMVDFNVFRDKFRAFHRLDFFTIESKIVFAYPAPVAVLYKLAYLIHWHPFMSFAAILLVPPAIGACLLWWLATRLGFSPWTSLAFFASAMAASFPLLFELKQGNVEIFVWALVVAGALCFVRGKGYSAAACFGIAGSMKIFPLVYLGLLIAKRQYRQVAFGFVVAAVSTVVSLWLLCPDLSVAWHGIQMGLALFQDKIALRVVRREIGFDHSLFSIVKLVWQACAGHAAAHTTLRAYLAIAAVTGTALFFARIVRLPVINQILCLCIASVVLPPVSYEYTLIHLYLPWGFLVLLALENSRAGRKTAGLNAALVVLAFLVSPLNEIIFRSVTIAGQIKAVLLMVLWYIALKYPFELPQEDVTSSAGPASLQGRVTVMPS